MVLFFSRPPAEDELTWLRTKGFLFNLILLLPTTSGKEAAYKSCAGSASKLCPSPLCSMWGAVVGLFQGGKQTLGSYWKRLRRKKAGLLVCSVFKPVDKNLLWSWSCSCFESQPAARRADKLGAGAAVPAAACCRPQTNNQVIVLGKSTEAFCCHLRRKEKSFFKTQQFHKIT